MARGSSGKDLGFYSPPHPPLLLLTPLGLGGKEGERAKQKYFSLSPATSCFVRLCLESSHVLVLPETLEGVTVALLSDPGDALGVTSSHSPPHLHSLQREGRG